MDIEEVAKSDPDAIKVHTINIIKGFSEEDAAKIVDELDLSEPKKLRTQAIEQLQNLYKMFLKLDAT